MQLTPHDEYLHKGYPKSDSTPWKENYYFNFIDEKADAMGIFHASVQRHKKSILLKVYIIVGGEPFTYISEIPWPTAAIDALDDSIVVGDENYCFRIVEPFLKHQVLFSDDGTSITLNFDKRFPEYLYPEKENTDRSFSTIHYEQGMTVKGEITHKGNVRAIDCLGHRDHTWGYRDESNLVYWYWIAIQSDQSTWNFCLVSRADGSMTKSGFVCNGDSAMAITDIEILSVEHNDKNEPIDSRYKITREDGEVFHITAKRYRYLPIPLHASAFVHENISEFVVAETGEKGMGIDEHMVGDFS